MNFFECFTVTFIANVAACTCDVKFLLWAFDFYWHEYDTDGHENLAVDSVPWCPFVHVCDLVTKYISFLLNYMQLPGCKACESFICPACSPRSWNRLPDPSWSGGGWCHRAAFPGILACLESTVRDLWGIAACVSVYCSPVRLWASWGFRAVPPIFVKENKCKWQAENINWGLTDSSPFLNLF